jgi:hypothetical protein
MLPQLMEIFGPVFFHTGMDKLAAEKLHLLGFDRADLYNCVSAWGATLYTKKAEYKKIFDGIQALDYLQKDISKC